MKRLTRWTSLKTPVALAAMLLIACQANAGFLSILKHGAPEPEKPAQAAAAPAESRDWQRVAFVGTATLKRVTGKVEFLSGVEKWSPAKPGQRFQPGDLIRTHDGSRAMLMMEASESFVLVTPKTILRLTQFETSWDQSVLTGREMREGYKVRALRGTAEYRKNNRWIPLSVNAVLPVGARVRTGQNTTVDLFHADSGSFIRMQPSAELALDPATKFPAKLVAAQTGPQLQGTKTAQVSP